MEQRTGRLYQSVSSLHSQTERKNKEHWCFILTTYINVLWMNVSDTKAVSFNRQGGNDIRNFRREQTVS